MSKMNPDKDHEAGNISKATAYPIIKEEYASLLPSLSNSDFEALKQSIKQNGLYDSIDVNQASIILDGHHRFEVCKALNIEPKIIRRDFKDPLLEKQFVIEINHTRRHLTPFQRIQMQVKLETIESELAKKRLVEAGKIGAERRWNKEEGKVKNNNNENDRVGSNDPTLSTGLNQQEKGRVIDLSAKKAGVSTRLYREGREIIKQCPPKEIIDGLSNQKLKIHKVFRQLEDQKKKEEIALKAEKCNSFLHEDVKLFHGDFIETSEQIPDNSADLILTDPPYHKGWLPFYELLGKFASSKLKEGGSLVMYAGHYALPQIFDYMKNSGLKYWWIIMVKHPGSSARMFSKNVIVTYKPLLWFTKGPRPKILGFIEDSVESQRPDKTLHTWTQSTDEAMHVISKLTVENDVVFDCLMGTGTTGIAAIKLNRKFVGIEKNRDTLAVARHRISRIISLDQLPQGD